LFTKSEILSSIPINRYIFFYIRNFCLPLIPMNWNQRHINILFYWLILIFTLLYAMAFSLIPYEIIVQWYFQLNPNFYKNDEWTVTFFNQETFSFGKIYCWVIVFLTFIMGWIQYQRKDKIPSSHITYVNFKITKEEILIFSVSMLTWWFWQQKVAYATDEVFSAVHFAGKPFFQTISHYPLPNNHLFFNAVNHWFTYIFDDIVLTGRLISGSAVAYMMVSIFRFSGRFIPDSGYRLIMILVLCTVFPIFGFATQARGYGLHMLLSWVAFTNIYFYTEEPKTKYLTLYGIATVLGLWTMPSFLYFWIGISMPLLFKMIADAKIDGPFILASIKIVFITLVLYLPVITFSGWGSVLSNKYVVANEASYITFFKQFITGGYFQGLFNEWFATGAFTWLGMMVLAVVFILGYFYSATRKQNGALLWYVLSLSISFLLMVFLMKKYPFYRNLVSHCLMFWVIFMIIIGNVALKSGRSYRTLLMIGNISLAIFFTTQNLNKFPFQLYYYDVNALSNTMFSYDRARYAGK
jgi:hypothetical protein